jgi:ribosomal-protein-alanine N-acetyltransferase
LMMRSMVMMIETASMKHLGRLYEIEKECFGEEAFSRFQIATLLREYNSISLIAVENKKIVGFIIGVIGVERNALDGHVLTIDVLPQYQQRGVGSKLLQAVERIFMGRNVKKSHLEVREDNVRALRLYERNGYRTIWKLKNYYGRSDGLYLCKSLA